MFLIWVKDAASRIWPQKWTHSPSDHSDPYFKSRIESKTALPPADYDLSVDQLTDKYGAPEPKSKFVRAPDPEPLREFVSYNKHDIIGTCGNCGGPVIAYTYPEAHRCADCGAKVRDRYGKRILMEEKQ